MAKRKFLDIIGLETYDEKIKAYIDGEIDSIPSDVFVVTITGNKTDGFNMDKSYDEIKQAYDDGKVLYVKYSDSYDTLFTLVSYDERNSYMTGFTFKNVTSNNKSSTTKTFAVFSTGNINYTENEFSQDRISTVNSNPTLTTTDKTLVGAINELDAEMDSHNHDDIYYTEEEIDQKLSAVNTNITNITSGSTPVKEAEHATSADTATNATNANHASSADTATTATSATKATQDGNGKVIANTYETKADAQAKLDEAKSYADTAAAKVKSDLVNGAGTAYDTLLELGNLIDDNKDAIDALEEVASGKANATHSHAIADITGLQSALDGKAAASHGTHVTFDSTNKPKMDGAAAFGTSSSVARADHVHPTDTSRASKTDFDTHVADTTKHITGTERTNWGTAYTHSQAAHAPSNAQANVIESIKVNGTAQTITSKAVNITVPTAPSDIGAAASTHTHAINDITNLQTTLNNASSAISANTYSISAHSDRIAYIETIIGDGFEAISSSEISALFSS